MTIKANVPYNIPSHNIFRVLEQRQQVQEVVGKMLQSAETCLGINNTLQLQVIKGISLQKQFARLITASRISSAAWLHACKLSQQAAKETGSSNTLWSLWAFSPSTCWHHLRPDA